jgi:hypothetical protein
LNFKLIQDAEEEPAVRLHVICNNYLQLFDYYSEEKMANKVFGSNLGIVVRLETLLHVSEDAAN